MELCVLCLDGLEPSLVSSESEHLSLEHRGLSWPPSASSMIAWKRFVTDKQHSTWWSDWRETVVLDLPFKATHWTENFSSESSGGLLFHNPPTDNEAQRLLDEFTKNFVLHSQRLITTIRDLPPTEVLVAYLGISDTVGHIFRDWHTELMHHFYQSLDITVGMIWDICRPKRRVVLSDHGMAPITLAHVGWTQCELLGWPTFTKRLDDGRHVVQSGQHWRLLPGYFSSDFLSGDQLLRKLGRRLRELT